MAPFRRILVPTDGSAHAGAAVAKGMQLAKAMGAEVTFLSVADYSAFTIPTLGYGTEDVLTAVLDGAKVAVVQASEEGEAMGLNVKTMVVEGSPADEIIKASKDYDLIVMGTLGRTGLSHLLLGSVAEKVARFASCPVMVIRAPDVKENK